MKKLSLVAIAALCAVSASAMEFQTLGYQSVSMGGAAVANSSGSYATYNNPALLAKKKYDAEIGLSVGVGAHDHDAGASFQALNDSGFVDTINKANSDYTTLTTQDKQNLVDGKNIIIKMNGNSLEITPQAALAMQFGSFGLGVFATSDIVATAYIDQTHNQLIFKNGTNYAKIDDSGVMTTSTSDTYGYTTNSIEYAMNNGLSYVQARGIVVGEVPLAYGHSFDLSGGNLMVGGALKYMQALTYTQNMKIDNSGSQSNSAKNDKTDTSFGVDLGLAYVPSFAKDLTLGLVGKDLNTPEFSFVDGTKVKLDPMIRAGLAYNIFESLEVAADIDLTKNKTLVSGADSQMVGGGLNYHPVSWFSLRGGAMQNLDSKDNAGIIYTAGLGFGFKWLQVDLSAQMASKTTTVDNATYPEYAKVNLALISRW
jgi:hypothetical protein